MKGSRIVILIAVVLLAFVGAAFASEMSGTVTAVNAEKGTFTLKSQTIDAGFDCESGSMMKGMNVGDQVVVEYKEEGGKKKATKITPMKPKPPVGC
jgi:hypothetical protein